MGLENNIFKTDYYYKPKSVNKFLVMIKFGNTEKRRLAFKNLVFRMMKDIVIKNISNYLNLLNNTPMKDNLPDRDELVSECFIIFNKCIEKYKVHPSHNFYFYFNKSLSRNFFRDYQRSLTNDRIELTEAMSTCHPELRESEKTNTIFILMENMNFTELEKRISQSRLLGQKTSEFLEENPDVTSVEYSKALKHIKEMLKELQKRGEI